MPKPISLVGHMHVCPKVDPGPRPHVGGPIVDAGQSFVKYNGVPVAIESGKSLCTGVPATDALQKGSNLAKINGKSIMRIGDSTSHGGKIVAGVPVFRSD